jgi:hypothetical protein
MKMQKLLKACVVAVLLTMFGGANVYAADKGPTVSDAHELLGDLIGSGLVYALNSSDREHVLSNYQGENCISSMNSGKKGASVRIDWSGITSVAKEETTEEKEKVNVTITGALLETSSDGTTTDKYKKRSFYFLDEASRRRVEKAMTLLMNSCAKKSKSKFD